MEGPNWLTLWFYLKVLWLQEMDIPLKTSTPGQSPWLPDCYQGNHRIISHLNPLFVSKITLWSSLCVARTFVNRDQAARGHWPPLNFETGSEEGISQVQPQPQFSLSQLTLWTNNLTACFYSCAVNLIKVIIINYCFLQMTWYCFKKYAQNILTEAQYGWGWILLRLNQRCLILKRRDRVNPLFSDDLTIYVNFAIVSLIISFIFVLSYFSNFCCHWSFP